MACSASTLLTLLSLPGVGRKTAIRLRMSLAAGVEGDLQVFFESLLAAGRGVSRFRPPDQASVECARAAAIATLAASEQLGISVLGLDDSTFPHRLREIEDPPAVLFVKGPVEVLNNSLQVAVIGTREPSGFGLEAARRIGTHLSRLGATVVSGLALGCDAAGHQGCLDVEGVGVAVLAHGLHTVSPVANRELAARLLAAGGCLVSEYAPGVGARRTHFVDRDRIQSGLSDGVIVIETAVKGGTMHTVRFARSQGRPVACVEHPERHRNHPMVEGNLLLMRQGQAEGLPDTDALRSFVGRIVEKNLASKGAPAEPAEQVDGGQPDGEATS